MYFFICLSMADGACDKLQLDSLVVLQSVFYFALVEIVEFLVVEV